MRLKNFLRVLLTGTVIFSAAFLLILVQCRASRSWEISLSALLLLAFGLGLAVNCVLILILVVPQTKRLQYILKIVESEGYNEHYFTEHNRILSKIKSPSQRAGHLMMLAGAYGHIGNMAKAFETIRQVDTGVLKGAALACYYNDMIYFYLQTGDIVNAERVYAGAKPIIEEYIKDRRYAGMLHTLAVREYMLGNYSVSLVMLENTLPVVKNSKETYAVVLFDLARVHNKLGNRQKAAELLSEAGGHTKSDYIRRQIDNLQKEINFQNITLTP